MNDEHDEITSHWSDEQIHQYIRKQGYLLQNSEWTEAKLRDVLAYTRERRAAMYRGLRGMSANQLSPTHPQVVNFIYFAAIYEAAIAWMESELSYAHQSRNEISVP